MAVAEILLLLAGIIAVIYFWSKHNNGYWRRKNIPFMEPSLLIGNIKDVFTMRTSFALHLSEIYNDKRFADAPAVGVYILNKPALVVREPELIKSVLIKDFNKFSNRYSACDPHGDALGSNMLFFVRNPIWKEIRTKVSPVFTSGKIKQMYPLMLEVANELEEHLTRAANTGTEFVTEVKEICALFTTDMIATIAFGISVNSLRNPNAEFRKRGREAIDFTLSRAKDFFVIFFLPQFVKTFGVQIFDKGFSKFLRDSINHVIQERERSGTLRNDLIDILVKLKKEAALEDNVKHIGRDTDFLVSQASNFFAAGFETSSSAMSFALYELAKHPDLQNRLRTEICDALLEGEGKIAYENMNSLEYLDMVMSEVLRLYPVLPFLDRQYERKEGDPEYTLKPYHDYVLPNGMPMYIPVYGLQRDPKFWPNPNAFDPERFSSENRKSINPISYMPFGTGPHNCIGSRIGLLQAKIGLVHILKNHYVTPCEKTIKEMRFEPKAFVLQCKGGVHLKLCNDRLFDKKSTEIITL